MLGGLLCREETSAALVLALSGMIVVLAANGPGPVLLKRVVSRALSNPVPGPNLRAHTVSACPSRQPAREPPHEVHHQTGGVRGE
jgi:hypothetical protein